MAILLFGMRIVTTNCAAMNTVQFENVRDDSSRLADFHGLDAWNPVEAGRLD
jgi:hypothetical protein